MFHFKGGGNTYKYGIIIMDKNLKKMWLFI